MDLVEVPVGDDDFTAQFLSDLFASEGVPNQLIIGQDRKSSLSRSSRHRIVVRASDIDQVEQMLADHAPSLLEHDLIEHVAATRSKTSSSARLLIGMPLLALALALVLSLLILVFTTLT